MRKSWIVLSILLVAGLTAGTVPARAAGDGWLVAARRVDGQDDIWARAATGDTWFRLSATPDDERWPAWSPDGTSLAYAARRNRNWDIYVLDLRSGEETRLTTDAHFDGWPAWNPDGTQIAFASMRAGDLDVFVIDLDSGELTNHTADSPAHDFAPAWHPTDNGLAFVTTRAGDHDIYTLNLADDAVAPLAETPASEKYPTWLDDGRLAMQVHEDRTTSVVVLDPETGERTTLSYVGLAEMPAVAPDGAIVQWLEPRGSRTFFVARDAGADGETARTGYPVDEPIRDLAWGDADGTLVAAYASRVGPESEPSRPAGTAAQPELVRLNDLDTGIPWLSNQVVNSYQALRTTVRDEVGYDFLGEVSETQRPINLASNDSDYLSWHKSGRAVDTLWDLGYGGGHTWLHIVREDRYGDVYWRIFLRCEAQDGSCGMPLTEAPWDLSYQARWVDAPGSGGRPLGFTANYYVDFTQLANDAGWSRIASYESQDFDWRENKTALEYWHYQHSTGMTWWQAMQEVYSADELDEWFNWPALMSQDIQLWNIDVKGIPTPSEYRETGADWVIP